jgi:hypothetical protein
MGPVPKSTYAALPANMLEVEVINMAQYSVQVKNHELSADMYYKNTLVLKYNINYPWFEEESFSGPLLKINQQYTAKAIAYQQFCEMSLYRSSVKEYEYSVKNGFPVRVFEAVVNYTVTYNEDCTLSLYFDQYEFTGGAHGNTIRRSDTWNVQDAHRIPLEEICPTYKLYIISIISGEIAAQIKSGSGFYFDDYEKNAAQNFSPENFYLKPSGIVVYFQQYEIAPYSSGIPEFFIPYSRSVIKPECK